jgi:hypothetical protein
MSANRWILFLVVCSAFIGSAGGSASASATESAAPVTGQVRAVYVRASGNFFIEKKLLRQVGNEQQWADVRPAQDNGAAKLYKLPENVQVEAGDLVATRRGELPVVPGLILTPSQVTQVVAKHDSPQAMLFGLANPQGAVHRFTQREACHFDEGAAAGAQRTCEVVAAVERRD